MRCLRAEVRGKGLQAGLGLVVVNMYKCLNCGKDVKIELRTAKKIICPYCGYRILSKTRPKVVKKVFSD
jgi:DNA-directed RNA polymerase subunit RPC12/RpoP